MDVVLCSEHQKPCYLKTGTKEGPNMGKNFYICSVSESRCQFVKPVNLHPLKCPMHPEVMVELQAIFENPKTQEKRHLLRCRSRDEGKKWCTYVVFKESGNKNNDDVLSFQTLNDSYKNSGNPSDASSQPKGKENHNQSFSQWRESPVNKVRQKDFCDNPSEQLKKNLSKHFQKEVRLAQRKEEPLSFKSAGETNKKSSTSPEVTKNDEEVKDKGNDSFSQWRDIPNAAARHKEKKASNLPKETLKKDLQRQLEKQKKLLSCTKVSQLPDNGARLIGNINDIEQYLEELELDDASGQDKENDDDIQIVSASFPNSKPKSKDDDGEVEVVGCDPPKPKSEPQVIKVFPPTGKGEKPVHKTAMKKEDQKADDVQIIRVYPPGQSGQQPIHKPTTEADDVQIIRVYPPGHSGQQPIHKPTTEGDPPKSVQDWLDRNYKIHKPYVAHNPDNMSQAKLFYDDFENTNQHPDYRQQGTFYGGRMTVKRLELVREAMKTVIDSLHKQLDTCPKEADTLADPEGLKVTLMQHQKQALAWLTWRENQIPSGGILADDMGLGKTLTMISLILTQKQRSKEGADGTAETSKWFGKTKSAIKSAATLIITPASLIHQWNHEIKSRCKNQLLRVLIYHGPNREKDLSTLASYDVVLTTYKIISSELGRKEDSKCADLPPGEQEKMELNQDDDKQGGDVKQLPLLLKITWNRIILDEAHDIRNHKSLCATAVCRLRANTRWTVTGTPIQNKLLDMFSLIRFLRFSPFDEYKVWKKQVESNEGLGKTRLNMIIKSLMLRRTKDQTFEGKPLVNMTKKEQLWTKLTLTKEERKLYDKIFKKTESVVRNYIQRHEDKELGAGAYIGGSSSSASQAGGNSFRSGSSQPSNGAQPAANPAQSGKDILMLLLRLRQCCGHPSLIKEKEIDEYERLDLGLEDQMKDLLVKDDDADSSKDVSASEEDIFNPATETTKISALLKEVTHVRETEKAKCVIVSEWTKMLSIVARHLKGLGLRYHLLQGDVPPHKRMEMVQDFNDNPKGPEVMLLSLKAGGVGLNLIGGSHLFLMDSHWNPALEEQTCDRIHRVGQKKDVKIHRFICQNTIEEKILLLQNKKRTLAKDVLSGDRVQASRLGLNDLRTLFSI